MLIHWQVYASPDIYEVKICPHMYIAMDIRKNVLSNLWVISTIHFFVL